MESIFATNKQYRCIIISQKNIVFMTFYGVRIESFTKKIVSKIMVSTTTIHALLPGQIFLLFLFFLSSIFSSFFPHSFYPSLPFLSLFFFYFMLLLFLM